jgi:hypothetical protein
LNNKFKIKSGKKKRINPNTNTIWRIRISKSSMEDLIELVFPYFLPEMLYKLGIDK